MADDFDFEVEGIAFRVKRTNQCKVIFIDHDPHCRASDRQKFWIHSGDLRRWYGEIPAFVRLFICTCRRCPHPRPDMAVIAEDFANSRECERYLRIRRSWLGENAMRADLKKVVAAKEASLDICRRIAVDGYTEEIAYEIMELIQGLPVGEGE